MTGEQKQKCREIVNRYRDGILSEVDALLEITTVEPRILVFQAFLILHHLDFPEKLYGER